MTFELNNKPRHKNIDPQAKTKHPWPGILWRNRFVANDKRY